MTTVHQTFPHEIFGSSFESQLRSEEAFDALPKHLQVPHGEPALAPERAPEARDAVVHASWKVQVFGQRSSKAWEISVVRKSNRHGQRSWGWFGDDKLLVSHNGGPCDWPLCGFVWDQQIAIANELCRRLNAGEDVRASNVAHEARP